MEVDFLFQRENSDIADGNYNDDDDDVRKSMRDKEEHAEEEDEEEDDEKDEEEEDEEDEEDEEEEDDEYKTGIGCICLTEHAWRGNISRFWLVFDVGAAVSGARE